MFQNKKLAISEQKKFASNIHNPEQDVLAFLFFKLTWRVSLITLSKNYLFWYVYCVKIVQIRSFFWSVFSRIRTENRYLRSSGLWARVFHVELKGFRIKTSVQPFETFIWPLLCQKHITAHYFLCQYKLLSARSPWMITAHLSHTNITC